MVLAVRGPAALAIALALAGAATAAPAFYTGLCDASAAVAIGAGRFAVADDERDVLQIYRRGTSQPEARVDLIDFLGNRKGTDGNHEADLEGAAAIGQRIYWIASHARKGGSAAVDAHRHRFFATDVVPGTPGPSLRPVGNAPVTRLLDDLVADPRFAVLAAAAARATGPEAPGGLNIEGLAAAPDSGLFIGFRNPLAQGRALLVPLHNPQAVVESGAAPRFGELVALDLGGRAIRSIERVGGEWLIAAGPVGTAADSAVRPAFALFRWAGTAAQAPALVRSLDTGSFRPEAMFVDPAANELLLLSDDGDERVRGDECKSKKLPASAKRFLAIAMPLPEPAAR